MSFILKALKKVEEEKAAKAGAPLDLNSAILSASGPGLGRTRRLTGWGVLFVVFLAGSAITYMFITKGPDESPQTPDRENAPVVKPSSPAPLPAASPASAPQAAVQEDRAAIPVSPAVPHAPAPLSPTPTTRAAAARLPSKPRILEKPAGSAPPGLILNGIAVQDDPADSVAIVNGALLKKGMTAGSGVRVEEILADKVRFSGKDGTFELQLQR